MKKILLPSLATLALAITPACFAEELPEEAAPAVEPAAGSGDSEFRNTLAEEARALSEKEAEKPEEDTEAPVPRKAKAKKPVAETEKPAAVEVKPEAPRVSERRYETGLATPSAAREWEWTLGGGIVISPDYKSMMEDAYGEVDASTIGWVDLQAGARYGLSEAFTFTPGLDLLINYFVPQEEGTFLSYILLPSAGIQYEFQNNPAYYLGAEVSYPLASSGSEELDLSAAGPGFGAYLGYMTDKEWNIEFGYSLLPVENGAEDEAEEYNLGGFVLKVNRRF